MGLYNQNKMFKELEKLNKSMCPICDSKIETNLNTDSTVDAFEYVCDKCSGEKVISIAGSVLASDNFLKIINDKKIRESLIEKINQSTSQTIYINSQDFR